MFLFVVPLLLAVSVVADAVVTFVILSCILAAFRVLLVVLIVIVVVLHDVVVVVVVALLIVVVVVVQAFDYPLLLVVVEKLELLPLDPTEGLLPVGNLAGRPGPPMAGLASRLRQVKQPARSVA